MEDGPLGHGRYHPPAVEPPADDRPAPRRASADDDAVLSSSSGAPSRWPRGSCRPRSSSSGRSCSSSRAGSSSAASPRTCRRRAPSGSPSSRACTCRRIWSGSSPSVDGFGRPRSWSPRRCWRWRPWSSPGAASRGSGRTLPPPGRPRASVGAAGRRTGLDHGGRGRAGRYGRSWASTAGARPRTDGCPVAGTGATSWSMSRSATSIAAGNFPPEVPYFAGEPLTYHWFADFHGAIASAAADLPTSSRSTSLPARCIAGVLALVVWGLAERLTGRRRLAPRSQRSWSASAAGSAGSAHRRRDRRRATSITALVAELSYDNTWADGWPFFRIASIFGTGFLPHRARRFGLPGLVAVILLVVSRVSSGGPPASCWPGFWPPCSRPFQFFAFPATYLIVGLYVRRPAAGASGHSSETRAVPRPGRAGRPVHPRAPSRQSARGCSGSSSAGARRASTTGRRRRVLLPDQPRHPGRPGGPGLHLPGRDRLPWRGFLVTWIVALFLVPNLVVVSAVEFDMNKYFQIMWIAVAILPPG